MNLALDRVRRAIDRGLERPKDADAFIMSAGSWLEDAEYEWKRLQAIRDGKE